MRNNWVENIMRGWKNHRGAEKPTDCGENGASAWTPNSSFVQQVWNSMHVEPDACGTLWNPMCVEAKQYEAMGGQAATGKKTRHAVLVGREAIGGQAIGGHERPTSSHRAAIRGQAVGGRKRPRSHQKKKCGIQSNWGGKP